MNESLTWGPVSGKARSCIRITEASHPKPHELAMMFYSSRGYQLTADPIDNVSLNRVERLCSLKSCRGTRNRM